MGSKGRMPPVHMRRPLPGPGVLHPDPFGPGMRPLPGDFPHPDPFGPGMRPLPGDFPFDMLPPPEIMEQKLDGQQHEMQRLLTENQRIAATHLTLRQDLAAAQHELERMQSHISAFNVEHDQQMRVGSDKLAKMEADLQALEPVKMELHQARAEAQSVYAVTQELRARYQQLTQELERIVVDAQQLPALLSEIDSLGQEYQHCSATYDYEMKLRKDHSEQLQVMEKNYVSMVREVEALRLELSKASNLDKSGVVYASNAGYNEADTPAHQPTGQNPYEDGYGVSQGRGPPGGSTNYGGDPSGQAPVGAGYPASRGAAYDASRNPGYDAPRAGSYEAPRGAGYDAPRASGYDASRGAGVPQPAVAVGNSPAQYGSSQMSGPYGSAQQPNYGSAQQPNYGSAALAQPTNYGSAGSTHPPNYGSAGSAQPPNYGQAASAQQSNYGSALPPNYGSTQPPNYGSAQAPNPYGAAQVPSAYRATQVPTQAAPAAGGGGYEAPHGGNAARR